MQQAKKSYLNAFKHVTETCKGSFRLTGGCLLVEEVPKEELKSASGLILAPSTRHQIDSMEDNRPMEVRVLVVGEGYYDPETGKDTPLDTHAGDILLVGKLSVKWLSSIAGVFLQEGSTRIGLVQESETQFQYLGQEGFDKFGQTLREGMTK